MQFNHQFEICVQKKIDDIKEKLVEIKENISCIDI